MHLDDVLSLCRAQPEATEDYPFDMDTLVFRVMGKIFALTNEASLPERVTLKCEPGLALELRDQFVGVEPGYHTNKRHWNTVYLEADVPAEEIESMIDHSYERVVQSLRKSDLQALVERARR